MSVQRILHCDAEGCEAHGSPEMPGWLTVSDPPSARKHFCNGDCLLKWAASWSEPPTTIPIDPEPER